MATFKDMLKYYRKRDNLSQAELARALSLSPSTISMYEVGEREPSFEVEEKIADFFNVDLNTLRGKDTESMDIELRPEEYKILKLFNELNADGQGMLVEYAEYLCGNSRYKK